MYGCQLTSRVSLSPELVVSCKQGESRPFSCDGSIGTVKDIIGLLYDLSKNHFHSVICEQKVKADSHFALVIWVTLCDRKYVDEVDRVGETREVLFPYL